MHGRTRKSSNRSANLVIAGPRHAHRGILSRAALQIGNVTSSASRTHSCFHTLFSSKNNSKSPFAGQNETVLLPLASEECIILIGCVLPNKQTCTVLPGGNRNSLPSGSKYKNSSSGLSFKISNTQVAVVMASSTNSSVTQSVPHAAGSIGWHCACTDAQGSSNRIVLRDF